MRHGARTIAKGPLFRVNFIMNRTDLRPGRPKLRNKDVTNVTRRSLVPPVLLENDGCEPRGMA